MNDLIDFTDLPVRKKTYAGANGSKLCVMYQGAPYMLKFPAAPSRNKAISYANGCISEYLGCHIFELIGIPVQETLLGLYRKGGKDKIVVACRDFTSPGIVLQDFASLKNTIIDSGHNGYGTELSEVLSTIAEQQAVDPVLLTERFWDMFIVDALIGNWDRHNGNWGFLYDEENDQMTLAPVYDCGSCLYPQADEAIMQSVLDSQAERHTRVFNIPTSGLKINNQKINYFDFLTSLQNPDCNRALKRIVPRIDMEAICRMVDETPFITDLQKQFYKTMLQERKKCILDHALKLLRKRERARQQAR